MRQRTKERGSAVIVALFVVALVAIASVAMLTHVEQDTERTQLMLNATHANFYVQGSVMWAEDQLTNDWNNKENGKVLDHTPLHSPVNTINNAKIETTIDDAQGFFNLNNLTDAKYQKAFAKIIKTLSPKMSDNDIQTLVLATVNWISATGEAGNDAYYAELNPPYRAPHRVMASVSELRLVKGTTSDLYQKLLPYVTALPATTQVNINNAKAPVLMGLSPTLTLDAAKSIELAAKEAPFATVDMFNNFDIVKNNPFTADQITTTSSYFLVTTYVTIGDQNITTYTLLERDTSKTEPSITILSQTKGTL